MTQLSDPTATPTGPSGGWIPPPLPTQSSTSRPLAVLSLTLLLVGVPTALGVSIGWPLPRSLPTVGDVQAVLSGPLAWSLVVDLLAIVAWAAWAHFSVCVVAELAVAFRTRRTGRDREPPRVPLGGISQKVARRLVQAALVTATIATTVGVPTFPGTMLTPARPASAAQELHDVRPVPVAAHGSADAGPEPATVPATPGPGRHQALAPHPEYVVQPPQGGYYDSLWGIAERFLGDGQRWREIYDLNRDRDQPDGRALSRPELIRPGWQLLLPHDAVGAISLAPEPEAAPDPSAQPGPAAESEIPVPPASPEQEAASAGSAPAFPSAEAPLPADRAHERAEMPSPAVSQAPRPSPTETPMPGPSSEEGEEDEGRELQGPAVGGLLAAAALAALATLRHRQRRRRATGESIPFPGAAPAGAEGQLRVLAEPDDLGFVDEALRAVTAAVSRCGQSPPDVSFARLRGDHLDLVLAEDRAEASPPFVAVDGGRIWRAFTEARPLLSEEEDRQALPLLPLLLTVGRDADGPVLLDLEAIGSLAIEGNDAEVTAVLCHLVAEAALAPWADGVEVLLVGFEGELANSLEQLAPDRVTAVDDLEPAMLRAVATRASRVTAAGDRLATRVHASGIDSAIESRPPLLVACASPPRAALAQELSSLVPAEGRGGVVVIAPAPWAAARAEWALDEPLPVPGQAPTPVPCVLDPARARSLGGSIGVARAPVSVPVPPLEAQDAPAQGHGPSVADPSREEPTPKPVLLPVPADVRIPSGHHEESSDADDELDAAVATYLAGTAPATVGFIGPVTVHATEHVDPDRRARLTEIVAYLAAHRRGAAVSDFDAALWPDRPVTLKTRNQAITRARAWLGADEDGVSWLRPMTDGALRLSRAVLVDWELFEALQERSRRPGHTPAAVRRDLETALRIVRGRPLSPLPAGRYGWLAETFLEQEIPSAVIDIAHRLGRMLLADGEAQAAIETARLALEVDRYDERPWRDLLEAHHLRGEHRQVEALAAQLRELLEVNLDDELQPETAELLERLVPRRRRA